MNATTTTSRAGVLGHLRSPLGDLMGGLDRCLAPGGRALLPLALGLLVGWWIYVPLHELAHAFGCMLAGGSVTRLDIDPLYGAAGLARIFPFVHAGSEYAGRLSGFDTGGSDLVYLATDLAPYLLTLLPGVWALRRLARRGLAFGYGALLPCAFAPFVSLTGDAYEIGSLLVVQLPPWVAQRELIGDDVALKFSELPAGEPTLLPGFALAVLLGIAWSVVWYGAASWLAGRLGEAPLAVPPRRPASSPRAR